ncbi:MAG: squalene--hopene cyclase [Chloroflexi bacterium]|nr:MAG: squalene--hopene cyclase [Chloroflexota bacterium]
MDRHAAITFVRSAGDLIEQACLDYLLDSVPPPETVTQQLFQDQREDGGCSPFWAPDYSSLDATCFHLAQAEQLGIATGDAAVRRALSFLAYRQRQDGSWEEDETLAEQAPPWARPGDLEARLYLTANCGFWLAVSGDHSEQAGRAASYLLVFLDDEGVLPGFAHTRWLAGGLWYRLNFPQSERVFTSLEGSLEELAASSLSWLLSTLLLAGVPSDHPLIEAVASRLLALQEPDGRWPSEDGPQRDVHATLEALRVLDLCHQL